MRRRFTFADTPAGKLQFWLCFMATARRGDPPPNSRQSTEDRRSEAKIIRALKAISEPLAKDAQGQEIKAPDPGMPDARIRTLLPGGGTLELDQPEFKRLQGYVDNAQWDALLTDEVEVLQDALDADAEKVPAPTPVKE